MKGIFKAIHRKESGFTLLELIVAISIIGIMTSTIIINSTGIFSRVEASPGEFGLVKTTGQTTAGQAEPTTDLTSPAVTGGEVDPEAAQTNADIAANQMEWKIIQTAVDTMMVRKGINSVKATSSTNDMTSFPVDNPLYPGYLRNQTGKCWYSCDSTGQVNQIR